MSASKYLPPYTTAERGKTGNDEGTGTGSRVGGTGVGGAESGGAGVGGAEVTYADFLGEQVDDDPETWAAGTD